MSRIFENLTKHKVEVSETTTAYEIAELRGRYNRIEELDGNNILALNADDGMIEYAFFAFLMGPSSGPGDERDDRAFYTCLWQGCGFGGPPGQSLREMRHIWFAPDDDDGYIYYPPIDATIKAFQVLKEYFDD